MPPTLASAARVATVRPPESCLVGVTGNPIRGDDPPTAIAARAPRCSALASDRRGLPARLPAELIAYELPRPHSFETRSSRRGLILNACRVRRPRRQVANLQRISARPPSCFETSFARASKICQLCVAPDALPAFAVTT